MKRSIETYYAVCMDVVTALQRIDRSVLGEQPSRADWQHLFDVFEKLHTTQNRKGFKMVLNDLVQWVKSLGEVHQIEITDYVQGRRGLHLFSFDFNAKLVANVLKNGSIANEDEERAVLEYLSDTDLQGDESKKAVQKLNAALNQWTPDKKDSTA
jgi:hypothetical protein